MYRHETKGDPTDVSPAKISEAFGSGKCPKLIEQCKSDNIEIRQRALAVLCYELRNPLVVVDCLLSPNSTTLQALQCLSRNLSQNDLLSRVRSAEAFAKAAEDANGKVAILHERNVGVVLPSLIKAARDDSMKVRLLVFRCLANLCETVAGAKSLVRYQGVTELLRLLQLLGEGGYAGTDDDETCTYALRAIASCCALHDGLIACLNISEIDNEENYTVKSPSSAVALSVQIILAENTVPAIAGGTLTGRATEASRTLSLICFSELGRDSAIDAGAVEALISLLSRLRELSGNTVGEKKMISDGPNLLSDAKLSTVNALSALTASDEAKLRFLSLGQSLDAICSQLNSNESAIQLAVLKVLSNVAVCPSIRLTLRKDPNCLKHIRAIRDSGSKIFERHAKIAEDAILWEA